MLSGKKRAQILTYLPQNMLYEKGHRVDEFILLANHPWRGVPERSNLEQRLQEALTICNIEHLRDRYLHTLSGGEKQRVFLAQVVFQDTPVILLDEPTTFLDFKHVLHIEDVLKYLLNKRKIILCVTHDLYMAQHLSTHILALKNGNTYASGATADILNVQLISQLFEIAEPYVEQRFRFTMNHSHHHHHDSGYFEAAVRERLRACHCPDQFGHLEELAVQPGTIQQSHHPVPHRALILFAADHGIAQECISLAACHGRNHSEADER